MAPLIARGASQEEQDALRARARAFYEERRVPEPPQPSIDEPAYPSSFAHVAQLIATGAPIPGIKHVPDKLNEEAPTEPQLAGKVAGAGRKPWEAAADEKPTAERPTIEHVFGSVEPPSQPEVQDTAH